MIKDEALRLALEALELHGKQYPHMVKGYCLDAITAIKEALETKDEPVAWRYDQAKYRTNDLRGRQWSFNVFSQTKPFIDEMVQNVTPLYTKPQQRKPLTDKQILADETLRYYFGQNGGAGPISKQGRKVIDAIEALHGIKENT
jgi:hypothetical protein